MPECCSVYLRLKLYFQIAEIKKSIKVTSSKLLYKCNISNAMNQPDYRLFYLLTVSSVLNINFDWQQIVSKLPISESDKQ